MYASIGAANALLRKRLRSKLDIMKLPTTSKRKRLTLKDEAVERPQDYLRIGASLLPKQMDVETDRPRQLIEYSNEELLAMVANGIEEAVERVLVDRGHSPLTPEERRIV